MAEELVTITVDGQELQAPKGAMLIEVTDRADIKVPRFCYHQKLSVAANCRMCLVEVEKAPKPLPACATPIMEGMVVHTQSAAAKDAQHSVMEFLLINHPLDCPICDQGGECELQDVAMGYGNDVSQYVEGKRVVLDKNIGPLIATELTRCIHCTRCVRFGNEIAGMRELGMTSRGENARIATSVEQTVTSEMSGNVIDLCPVGALTAKPSRFAARAWEMMQHASVAPHDCVGSNLFIHTLRGEVIRVVPRDNEAINEVWISDRDRFSYEGVSSEDRLTSPMIKQDGEWKEVDWDIALKQAAEGIKSALIQEEPVESEPETADEAETEASDETETIDESGPASKIAAFVSPSSTIEELYLAQKLMRSLGSGNIDHRLRQADFSDQDAAPVMPWLGQNIEDLEKLDAAMLVGSNVRKQQPMVAHRLRKAALNKGADISFVNTRAYDFHFPVASNIAVAQQQLPVELASIAAAVFKASGNDIPAHLSKVLSGLKPTVEHKSIASQLKQGEATTVLLGDMAGMHPNFSTLRALAEAIAVQTDSVFGYLSEGANAAGAWLAGAVPHRGPAGATEDVVQGAHAGEFADQDTDAVLLLNVEPDADFAQCQNMMDALNKVDTVVAITAFDSPALRETADVMLPAAVFTETSGTYVNAEGFWQSFNGVCQPAGEARPAWKILRVLGNLLKQQGFDFVASDEVRDELRSQCESIELSNVLDTAATIEINGEASQLMRSGDVPMYSGDALLRRASSLQQTQDAQVMCVRLNSDEAGRLGVAESDSVLVKQGSASAQLNLVIDESIPSGSAWIPMAVKGNELLGDAFGEIVVEKV
jgi:NADH-quinone oxidoreductase subunit G